MSTPSLQELARTRAQETNDGDPFGVAERDLHNLLLMVEDLMQIAVRLNILGGTTAYQDNAYGHAKQAAVDILTRVYDAAIAEEVLDGYLSGNTIRYAVWFATNRSR